MKKKLSAEHTSIALFITAVTASALTMLWLLWHFPLATATAALCVLAGLIVVARITKSVDVDAADADDSSPAG